MSWSHINEEIYAIDTLEIDKFQVQLLKLAGQQFPKETRAFLINAGNRMTRTVRKAYKKNVRIKTGNLTKGLHRGKVYKYGDEYQVRVKNSAPHAHLIEYGHNMCNYEGVKTGKYVKGKYIMTNVRLNFDNTYEKMIDKFIDKLLDKGLG